MQKYWFSSESPMGGLMETEEPSAGHICPESGPYYLASEVDARIDELERALKSCVSVLAHHIAASNVFDKLASEAMAEADKVTLLMGG